MSKLSRTVKTDDFTSGTRDVVKQECLNASSRVKGLIKNTENRLFPPFSLDLAFYEILWEDLVVLCSKVDFTKKLGTLLNPLAPGNLPKNAI